MRQSIPFPLLKTQSFFESLSDWLGDMLYDVLPEKGYECRDEQIFMSYQIVNALKDKTTLFAEAGVGTGKTIAYLLPAIAYARYTGKPALIACSDETLIDQLVKEEGDLSKLKEALNLKVDVRLAKSRDQYLCLKRFEEAEQFEEGEFLSHIKSSIPSFVYGNGPKTVLAPYGDRSSYPTITDEDWQKVNYHTIEQCTVCDLRNLCGQTLNRGFYREATDLLICSHDFLMEHLWTKESRVRQGQLPLLPEVSMMVLDEGHLLEFAAQKALTYEVQETTIIEIVERIMVDGVREKTLRLMEQLLEEHEFLFTQLKNSTIGEELERKAILKTDEIINTSNRIIKITNQLLEEFVFESEMYTIPEYELRMTEEYLEQYLFSLKLFIEKGDAIDWMADQNGVETLTIMPRLVTEILDEKLFSSKLPIIFSSATLSVQKDFTYLASSLGIDEEYQSFSVPSPFEYEEVMKIFLHETANDMKHKAAMDLLQSKEPTLILFKSKYDMLRFKNSVDTEKIEGIVFEGERELSSIIRDFQNGEILTVCSYHLWEGLDIPNEALTRVIIYDLPFPPHDPLFEARRKFSKDPYTEVELPFMQLRLQQGIGRLIRTSADYGSIHLLLNEEEMKSKDEWQKVLPVEPVHQFVK